MVARHSKWPAVWATRLAAVAETANATLAFAVRLATGLLLITLMARDATAAGVTIQAQTVGTFETGRFNTDAAAGLAYDPANARLYSLNRAARQIDLLTLTRDLKLQVGAPIELTAHTTGDPARIARAPIGLAVSVRNRDVAKPGEVLLFDNSGDLRTRLSVGPGPIGMAFSPDGATLAVANAGDADDDYANDPEGSLSLIDVATGTARVVRFDNILTPILDPTVHLASPLDTPVANDLAPRHVTINATGELAFVTLTENNAIAVVDIATATVTRIFGAGFQDYQDLYIDASDTDKKVRLRHAPLYALRQPSAVAAFRQFGQSYIVVANQGRPRHRQGYSELARISELTLDRATFGDAVDALQANDGIGRLQVTTARGDIDADGDFDELYAFGGRSFSVFNITGALIFDSGDEFARILSGAFPAWFNSDGQQSSRDARSDERGVEPAAVAVGRIGSRTLGFIGLRRMGGVMVYDLTEPRTPRFLEYMYNADPKGDPVAGTAGDVGTADVLMIPATDSPNGLPLLAVANAVSGTVTVYALSLIAPRGSVARN